MTIADDYEPVIYTGNGATTNFPFAFHVEDEDHLKVYLKVIATDVLSLLDPSEYDVNGVPGEGSVDYEPGGNPIEATHKLIIAREVPYDQDLDITNQGGYTPEPLEDQLDHIVMQTQQLAEKLTRAVVASYDEEVPDIDDIAAAADAATEAVEAAAEAVAAAAAAEAVATARAAHPYDFSTSTVDSDPGAGILRLNNGTEASATAAYIDNLDDDGNDISALMDTWDDSTNTVRGSLLIRSQADVNIWHNYNVTGSVTDGTGYRKLTIAHVDGEGEFTAAMPLWVFFVRAGNKGTDGAGVGDVVGPASSTNNAYAKFDGATGKLLKDGDVTIPIAGGGTGQTSAAAAFGALKQAATDAATGVLEHATVAEYRAATAGNLALIPANTWAAAAVVALTDGATIAVDMSAGFNFGGAAEAVLALGGDRTLGTPSNKKSGQTGFMWFGATGATRTLTLHADYKLIDGVEVGPYSIETTQELGLCYMIRGTVVVVTGILRRDA